MTETTAMESEPITIASLNQYVFCPRRSALMFVEGYWADNEHTAVGTLLHDHADVPGYETDAGVTILRAVPLFSERHGLSGKADIVEVRRAAKSRRLQSADQSAHSTSYSPVEYKKGKRRKWDNDDVQLCAQAFCLEEMFSVTVPEGFIYHAGSKRRRKVIFDQPLRNETLQTIAAVRSLITNREVPAAVLKPRCAGCSLHSVCLPELTQVAARAKVESYEHNLWR